MSDPIQPNRDHGADEGRAREDLGFALPEASRMSRGRAFVIGVAALLVLGVAFLFGWLPRRHAQAALAQEVRSELPRVEVVTPKVASSDRDLLLPGSVQSLEETTLYPRASGFVRKWLVDIGDHVTEGQLMAEIETPELDQELEQAQAQLGQGVAGIKQAQANRIYSTTALERAKQLTPAGLSSQADLDKAQAQALVDDANVSVAEAALKSQQANVRRLQQLKLFARVTAPFAGTVVSRTIERGSLVSAGNTSPLYKIAATDTVRVFIQVPQDVAPNVHQNAPAKTSVREYPGRTFDATVTRAAGVLDSATRTMTVEIRIPNPKGELFAGMYAQVAFSLPTPHKVLEVPATGLFNDAKGTRLAVVTDDDHIHLVPVVIERDTGSTLGVSTGIDEKSRVVKLASADLVEGAPVEVAKPAPPAADKK